MIDIRFYGLKLALADAANGGHAVQTSRRTG
jgi:hypothetical protein